MSVLSPSAARTVRHIPGKRIITDAKINNKWHKVFGAFFIRLSPFIKLGKRHSSDRVCLNGKRFRKSCRSFKWITNLILVRNAIIIPLVNTYVFGLQVDQIPMFWGETELHCCAPPPGGLDRRACTRYQDISSRGKIFSAGFNAVTNLSLGAWSLKIRCQGCCHGFKQALILRCWRAELPLRIQSD